MISFLNRNIAAIKGHEASLANRLLNLSPSSRVTSTHKGAGNGLVISAEGEDGVATIKIGRKVNKPKSLPADKNISARFIIILGFGSGKTLSEIVSRTDSETLILVVEPDIELFAEIIKQVDFSSLFALERVSLMIGDKSHDNLIARVENWFGAFTITNFPVIEDKSVSANEKYFANIRNKVEHLKKTGEQNKITLRHQGILWRSHILENLPVIIESEPAAHLFGKYEGVLGILVGAGPSLSKNGYQLLRAKGRAIIIAADTAVRSLIQFGVTPDVVVSVDTNEANLNHLDGLDLTETILVAHPAVYPYIARLSFRAKYFFGCVDPLFSWIETNIGNRGTLLTGGTVMATALDLARMMGLSPVAFVGQDLSFHDEGFHAKGSYTNMAARRDAKAIDMESFKKEMVTATDLFGRSVHTLPKMETWKKWFEIIAHKYKINALNATEGGLSVNGVPSVSLDEVISRYALKEAPPIPCGRDEYESYAGADKIAEKLETLRNETRQIKSACARSIKILKNANSNIKISKALRGLEQSSKEIFMNLDFAELNRFWIDEILDKVDLINRSISKAKQADSLKITVVAYNALFTGIYEVASLFEKDLTKSLRKLKVLS